MNKPVKMYDLFVSPNSVKVRLALGAKKIAYEKIAINPQDRSEIVKISGQPLTPVLVHGDSVVYDSYGILRYIDANWPTAPRLFSADREVMKQIESWELFNRNEAMKPVSLIFGEFFAKSVNPDNIKKANDLASQIAGKIEDTLSKQSFLTGNEMTAADLTIASTVATGLLTETQAKESPIFSFFHKNLKLTGFPKTIAWVQKVMAYDKQV